MKISIIGSKGQLGSDLLKTLSNHHEVQGLTHEDVEVTDAASLLSPLSNFRPDWVINTAAYHKVELCEQNPTIAFQINEIGARTVAEVADSINARTVFISTDYVFSGNKPFDTSYSELDKTDPVNVYGKSKLAGELATSAINSENLVCRISSVFGTAGSSGKGGNFVEAIVSKLKNGEMPEVVSDNRMSPTYTVSAAGLLLNLLESGASDIFHINNSGAIAWFQFADKIAELLGHAGSVNPKSSEPSPKVQRPVNSSLDNSKIRSFSEVQDWEQALAAYLSEKGYL